MWLSPRERDALAHEPVYVEERHRKIVVNPDAHHWILRFLLD